MSDRRAVDHGGIDNLALAGAGGLEQGGRACRRPATCRRRRSRRQEVRRRHQAPSRSEPDGAESTADGDVVDVVAGHGCHRPLLTPPRHAPVEPATVAPEAGVGPDTQSLGHAGPGSPRSSRPLLEPARAPTRRRRDSSGGLPTEGRDRFSRSQYGPEPEAAISCPRSTAPGAARWSRRTWAPASAGVIPRCRGPARFPPAQ